MCNSKILNWWLDKVPNSTELIVTLTKSDGNCLCHAISQVLKSTDDTILDMRSKLYDFFQIRGNELHDLWKSNALREQKQLGDAAYVLTNEQMDTEWKEIVETASAPEVSGSENHFTEKIHVFALANLLETPIIEPGKVKPIFITHHFTHFSALFAKKKSTSYRVPIVDASNQILRIHFMDDEFFTDSIILMILKQYLCIRKADEDGEDGNIIFCEFGSYNFIDAESPENEVVPEVPDGSAKRSKQAKRTADTAIGAKKQIRPATSIDYKEIEENIHIAKVAHENLHNCDCEQRGNVNCTNGCINRSLFIECSPEMCKFKEKCANMTIQKSRPLDGLVVCETSNGLGLITDRGIKNGTFVIEYVGEVVSMKEFKIRSETKYAKHFHCYGMSLDRDLVIDSTKQGNKSRYINHSCTPNCEIQKWIVNGLLRMAIFAKKDIEPNEELTYDYKFYSFDTNVKPLCNCLTKGCRGTLSRISSKL